MIKPRYAVKTDYYWRVVALSGDSLTEEILSGGLPGSKFDARRLSAAQLGFRKSTQTDDLEQTHPGVEFRLQVRSSDDQPWEDVKPVVPFDHIMEGLHTLMASYPRV